MLLSRHRIEIQIVSGLGVIAYEVDEFAAVVHAVAADAVDRKAGGFGLVMQRLTTIRVKGNRRQVFDNKAIA